MKIELLLIGSGAMRDRGYIMIGRGRDVDYIATPAMFNKQLAKWERNGARILSVTPSKGLKNMVVRMTGLVVEYEIALPGSTGEELLDYHTRFLGSSAGSTCSAFVEALLALKLSHRFRRGSKHFEKTRADILRLRSVGVTVPDDLKDWLARREKETLSRSPSLATTKEGFFRKETVPYRYDHDSLHEVMAIGERPAYLAYQKDGAEVMVDMEKWRQCSPRVQLAGVVEEACVLALERHQIPQNFTPDPFLSYKLSLQRICTGVSSGVWREFAWDFYDDLLKLYPANYVMRFKEALEAGKVREFNGA
jgi:hypothetical protein